MMTCGWFTETVVGFCCAVHDRVSRDCVRGIVCMHRVEQIRFRRTALVDGATMVHGVFKAALNGMHDRGAGGFVYVKGDACAYMFPRELQGQPQLCESLEEMLADEKASRVFYVVNERDGQLHIVAYPRDSVLRDMVADGAGAATSTHELKK